MTGVVTLVRCGEPLPANWSASVYLAGPAAREPGGGSWRAVAASALAARWHFPGKLVIFDPELPDRCEPSYDCVPADLVDQARWEEEVLAAADIVAFWVPRDLHLMPGLNTNVKWGAWYATGRCVLAAPSRAPGNAYLRLTAQQHDVPVASDIPGMTEHVISSLGGGAERAGPSRQVPLLVWRTEAFRRWQAREHQPPGLLRVVWSRPGRSGQDADWVLEASTESGSVLVASWTVAL